MPKDIVKISGDSAKQVLGENVSKIYTHAVFAQCVLPVRSLPNEITHYEVKHGNASLMIQSGVLWDDKGNAVKMEVPAGPKARILLPYIIDQVVRNDSPEVDMGDNMYRFMQENNIKIGGANRKELQRQINNIAASSINIGVWGETETHRFGKQKTYRVASEVSFWHEKDINQLTFWNPTLTISAELMDTLNSHRVLIDMKPLIELQNSPRAMDMYMWLSYRIQTVKRPIKISYKDLHSIFGKGTKALRSFKQDFIRSTKEALPYLKNVNVNFEGDKKHIILSNNNHSVYLSSIKTGKDIAIEDGIFGELKSFGVPKSRIEHIAISAEKDKIKKAIDVTRASLEKGNVKNPAGFFTKALNEGWGVPDQDNSKVEKEQNQNIDEEFERLIKDKQWKIVRMQFAQMKGIPTFNSWIKDLTLEEKNDSEVVLKAKSRFVSNYVQKNFSKELQALWKAQEKALNVVKIVY